MHDAREPARCESRRHLRIDVGERACVLEQYMFLDQRERVQRMPIVTIPRVMKIQGRAVIDEPESAVPHEHIDVAYRPVHIAYERIKPNDRRSQMLVRHSDQGVEGDRPGQIVQSDIQAGAGAYEALYFGIGLGARQFGGELDEDYFRDRQPRQSSDFTSKQFRDQGF